MFDLRRIRGQDCGAAPPALDALVLDCTNRPRAVARAVLASADAGTGPSDRTLPLMEIAIASVALAAFVLVHLFIGRIQFLGGTPRSRWLSAAGGVSVAYVFLHLLPELGKGQQTLAESFGPVGFAERHVYLIAMLGLVLFYGLERLASTCSDPDADGRREAGTSAGVFALHIASFGMYNALIGYLLLHREDGGVRSLALFALAMALHFVVNDHGLREHHKRRYDAPGRWVISLAAVAGFVLGLFTTLHKAMIAVLIAFLAGGVVLNVIKEELPKERESRFSAFLAGAAMYSALLLAL